MLVPLQWTLQTCLYSHLLSQYRLVSSTLLQILKEEHKLLDYFAAIRVLVYCDGGGGRGGGRGGCVGDAGGGGSLAT